MQHCVAVYAERRAKRRDLNKKVELRISNLAFIFELQKLQKLYFLSVFIFGLQNIERVIFVKTLSRWL